MIKKNTKMIFDDGLEVGDLVGGVPLCKGEVIRLRKNGNSTEYEVTDKLVEFDLDDEDQTANITYSLERR